MLMKGPTFSHPPRVEEVEVYRINRPQDVHGPFQVHLPFPACSRLVKVGNFPLGSNAIPGSARGNLYRK